MSKKSNTDWVSLEIIDDDDDNNVKDTVPVITEKYAEHEQIIVQEKFNETTKKISVKNKIQQPLKPMFDTDTTIIEIGVDEAGRGPMFGRVYAGVAVLPKDDSFNHFEMKDSKKFHSKKKIEQVADYIKNNAIAWAVEYEDESVIDNINILQATQSAMHKGIKNVLSQLTNTNHDKVLLLIDGNYFKPLMLLNKDKTKLDPIKYHMIEGGDNKYSSIAAASILAKVERDKYIDDLCDENPELIERYGINTNKGYGSKKHMDGIKQYGITKWHRRTFGICKEYC